MKNKNTWITQQLIVDILNVDESLNGKVSIRNENYVSIKFQNFSLELRIEASCLEIWVQERTAYVVTAIPTPSKMSAYFSKHLRYVVYLASKETSREVNNHK